MPDRLPDDFSTRSAGQSDGAGGTPPDADEAPLIRAAREGAEAATPGSADRLRAAPYIDGYEFVRELHRGGQGVVYQALEKATKRKVAIKILLEGPYASDHARRRFEREIELAASLKHPNIVAVFHSGLTADGRQFCVMDYVRGVPLHQYVREQKLTMEDALKLFAKVCEAVNYAHQKGIIHRDLKPSNILVDSDGSPKVLDFGLAKLVGGPEQTLVSMTGQVVGTLPYLSPEQARGNPDEIDIRTDVYSLGVVLYELLTGQFPYPVIGQMADVLRHIAGTEPTPPSRSWKADSGVTQRTSSRKSKLSPCPIDDEVQTIILRALTKERQRRYQSAADLGNDIGHYLRSEPIEAKKDSALYVLRKQLRLYRVPAAIATAFMLSLIAGLAGTLWKASEAKRHARRADDRALAAERAEAVQRRLSLSEAAARRDAEQGRRDAEDAAKRAANLIGHIATLNKKIQLISPADDRVLTFEGPIARLVELPSGREVATLRGHSDRIRLAGWSPDGRRLVTTSDDKSIRLWDARNGQALAALRGHVELVSFVVFSPNSKRLLTAGADQSARIWDANSGAAVVSILLGEPLVGVAFSDDGNSVVGMTADGLLNVWDSHTGVLNKSRPGRPTTTYLAFAGGRIVALDVSGAFALWDPITLRLEFEGKDLESARPSASDSDDTDDAYRLYSLGRLAEAEPLFREVLEKRQRLLGGDHPDVATSMNNLALCLNAIGRSAEALPKFEAALEMRQRLFKGDHPDVALGLNNVAACLKALGRPMEALPKYEAALEMLQRLHKGDHSDVAVALNNVANCLISLDRPSEALPKFKEALDIYQRLFKGDHPDIANGLNNVASCLVDLDRRAEALPKFEAALEMRQRLFKGDHPDVAQGLNNVAACLKALGRPMEALPKYEAALEMLQRLFKGDHPNVASCLGSFATCLAMINRLPEALDNAQRSAAMAARILPEGHSLRKNCEDTLAEIRNKMVESRHQPASSKPSGAPANSIKPGE